jgi:hypothetical protein
MERAAGTYGWVFAQVRVDPNDPETVYFMGLDLNQSTDGGKTFKPLEGMHGDHHALWIDPANSSYLFNGNDGGVCVSYDKGSSWRTFTDNLPAVQFFNVSYDMSAPFYVYGSIQDHGSMRGLVDLSRGRDQVPGVAPHRPRLRRQAAAAHGGHESLDCAERHLRLGVRGHSGVVHGQSHHPGIELPDQRQNSLQAGLFGGDRVDHRPSVLVERQGRHQRLRVGAVGAERDLDRLGDDAGQPGHVPDFLGHAGSRVHVDEAGSGLRLPPGLPGDPLGVALVERASDPLAAGVDPFADDEHGQIPFPSGRQA